MTKRKSAPVPAPATETVENTYGPSEGGNAIFAAWRGLYHLFGARMERFDITPEGIVIVGLTVAPEYDVNTVVDSIVKRGEKTVNPRLDFLELYPQAMGEIPAPFVNAKQLTAWLVKYMKGGSRSPKFAKDAIAIYKTANGFAVHRGRPRKVVRIADIGNLDEAALAEVSEEERAKLRATLDALSTATVEEETLVPA